MSVYVPENEKNTTTTYRTNKVSSSKTNTPTSKLSVPQR